MSPQNVLQNKFKDLDEIIKSNQLEERLIQICQCENNVFPVWLQGPDWPIVKNEPAIFIKQSIFPNNMTWDFDEIEYCFRDLEGNDIVVKQFT